MLDDWKDAFLRAYQRVRRSSRRNTPSPVALEPRTLLTGQGTVRTIVEPINHSVMSIETPAKAAKVNPLVPYVNGLYKTYFHHAPTPEQLNYALQLVWTGALGKAALKNEFVVVTTKNSKKVNANAFVNALYVTVGARPPTPEGRAYWLGQVTSGLPHSQVLALFKATNGMLPAPVITWPKPPGIVYGTALSGEQLNAVANVPGTFIYSPAAGTVPYAFPILPLSATFIPADTTDYAPVTASNTLSVHAQNPTITWQRPHAIMEGTPLTDLQLNATATAVVNGQTVPVYGTFTYSSPVGTVLPVGVNLALTAVFRPFDSLDYSVVIKTTNITVTLGPPPPTPTPPLPTPPPTPSPTPSPTPYPTPTPLPTPFPTPVPMVVQQYKSCLLYTSDAADD